MYDLTLFTSSKCPECPPVIKRLEDNGIKFRNVDISNSISELKEFLRHRDSNPFFDSIKENDFVGVPTLMDEDGNFYNPDEIEDLEKFK